MSDIALLAVNALYVGAAVAFGVWTFEWLMSMAIRWIKSVSK